LSGRYALIVANDLYEDVTLRKLRAPARDAAALRRVLSNPLIGDFDAEVFANEPEHLLRRRLHAFFDDRAPDDLLLLHISCHGLKDVDGELYFAARDTEVARLDATAVPAEYVVRQMKRTRCRQVVVLLDCCYSGAISRVLRFRGGRGVAAPERLVGRGRAVITASSAMEYAFEGDEVSEFGEDRPSVFTRAVVTGLESGDADRDGDRRVSVSELYEYVSEHVCRTTPHQRPGMLSQLEGELYIAKAPKRTPAETVSGEAAPASPDEDERRRSVRIRARIGGATLAVAVAGIALALAMRSDAPPLRTAPVTAYHAERACQHSTLPTCRMGLARDPHAAYTPSNVAARVRHGDRLAAECYISDGTRVAAEDGRASARWYRVRLPSGTSWLPAVLLTPYDARLATTRCWRSGPVVVRGWSELSWAASTNSPPPDPPPASSLSQLTFLGDD
jgi:uncharacterized caspase-like protein